MQGKQSMTHGLIEVSGPDAAKLLQGQLTCDIERLSSGQATLAAHCNPRGRVISLFHLVHIHSAYYLLLPRNMVDIALTALKKFAVFYKVTLSDITDQLDNAEFNPLFNTLIAETYPYVVHLLPMVYPTTSQQFLPHELTLPELGAVSFEKGCYTGQEIIARMEYRGKSKKQMRRATIDDAALLTPGTTLFSAKEKQIGIVIDAYDENHHQTVLVLLDEDSNDPLFIEGSSQALILQATPERNTP